MTAVLIALTSLLLSRPAWFHFVCWIRGRVSFVMDHHSSVVPAPSP